MFAYRSTIALMAMLSQLDEMRAIYGRRAPKREATSRGCDAFGNTLAKANLCCHRCCYLIPDHRRHHLPRAPASVCGCHQPPERGDCVSPGHTDPIFSKRASFAGVYTAYYTCDTEPPTSPHPTTLFALAYATILSTIREPSVVEKSRHGQEIFEEQKAAWS